VPTVSVIIPAYNAAEFLAETLDSALLQTHSDFEVLVIDDGSTDDTSAIAASYGPPVRLIRTANQGAALARNTGIDAASAEFAAFLDADDLWEPDKLARQLDRIDERCRFVYTDTISFGHEELTGIRMSSGGLLPSGDVVAKLIEGNFIATSSVLLDLEIARRAGGFDPKFRIAQDWILWLRAARLTRVAAIQDPLVHYRMHPGSLGSDIEQRISDCRGVIDEGLTMVEMPEARKAKLRNRAVANEYLYGARLAAAQRQGALARRCSWAAFTQYPTLYSAKQVVKSLLGPKLTRWLGSE
jgi:glycosyltransferase involved in cell wall biosynthesis